MICSNCGFSNAPGDEFCGSCGQFLEWTAKPDEATAPASPLDDATTVMPAAAAAAPSPPPAPAAPPPAPSAAPPPIQSSAPPSASPTWAAQPTPPQAGPTSFAGRAPDVICWNCSRRNPPGRSFCIQCGERLTAPTAAGAGAGAAAGTTASAASDGSDRGRMIAVGLGALAVLLVAGIAAAVLLGGAGPTPTPSGIAVGSATPSVLTPTASVIPSTVSPMVTTTTTATLTPSPELTLTPTEPPTPQPTPRRTRKPTPTPEPTPEPTPLNCDAPQGDTKVVILTPEDPTRTIKPNRGWCLRDVTFNNDTPSGAEVKFKLYLINEEAFADLGAPYRYGWLEEVMTEPGNYNVSISYPPTYMENGLEPGTTIEFAIESCTAAPGFCVGSVRLEYEPGPPPPP